MGEDGSEQVGGSASASVSFGGIVGDGVGCGIVVVEERRNRGLEVGNRRSHSAVVVVGRVCCLDRGFGSGLVEGEVVCCRIVVVDVVNVVALAAGCSLVAGLAAG